MAFLAASKTAVLGPVLASGYVPVATCTKIDAMQIRSKVFRETLAQEINLNAKLKRSASRMMDKKLRKRAQHHRCRKESLWNLKRHLLRSHECVKCISANNTNHKDIIKRSIHQGPGL